MFSLVRRMSLGRACLRFHLVPRVEFGNCCRTSNLFFFLLFLLHFRFPGVPNCIRKVVTPVALDTSSLLPQEVYIAVRVAWFARRG
jgi:hypothetical protein